MPEKYFPIHHTHANDLALLNKESYNYLLDLHKKVINKSNVVIPFLAPLEYKSIVMNKHIKFTETFSKIKNSGLNDMQQK